MAPAPTTRRLPGFRFEAQPPPLAELLPRMDVALFVGFAAAGPLGRPVVVEDAAQFEAVFGGEVALAWDRERGERVTAHLAPAVRAFFRNGGRRCWVLRVAGSAARANLFPVPGLVRVRANGRPAPAYASARSKGSWSDSLQTSAALLTRPLIVTRFNTPFDFDLEASARDEVGAGDLVRLSFGKRYVLLVVARKVEPLAPEAASPPGTQGRPRVRVTGGFAQWFRVPNRAPVPQTGRARVFTVGGRRVSAEVEAPYDWRDGRRVRLLLSLAPSDAPAPGSYVHARFGRRQLWLRVADVRAGARGSHTPGELLEVSGEALWWLRSAPKDVWAGEEPQSPPAPRLPLAEKLLFELSVRRGDAAPMRLSNLAFGTLHARFWGALPSDEELYADPETRPAEGREEIRRAALNPRFPLAGRGRGRANEIFLPVLMPYAADEYLGGWKRRGDALVRDGLAEVNSGLFFDDELSETGIEDLLTRADFIRFQSPRPRALRGIHSALSLEEATIIAVPDAAHRGWEPSTDELDPPQASDPLPHPEWFGYLDCNPPAVIDPEAEPERGHFLDCRLRIIEPPDLEATEPDAAGSFVLTWSSALDERAYTLEESPGRDWRGAAVVYEGAEARAVLRGRDPGEKLYYRVRSEVAGVVSDWVEPEGHFDDAGDLLLTWQPPQAAAYVLEESVAPDWSSAAVIHRGLGNSLPVYGRSRGGYYYRVRAEVGALTSDWSAGVGVLVAPGAGWVQNPEHEYRADDLLEVHCALLRLCAARGDLFAVLSLPEHYREEKAVRHVAAVKPPSTLTQANDTRGGPIVPLRYGETRALSYGALYHPWLISREEEAGRTLARNPPDGAAAGLLARRSIERGPWIAPANEPLSGVVALSPRILPSARPDLQQSQVNLFRQDPRGFLALSADTLSDELDWRPVGVRRLMMLLRRLALRLGATYVFEPNGDAFRRLVRRGFERMLGEMFSRGAFAGATPEASFRVVTTSELNTPRLADQGRFIVELKVAPSLPLTFLTLRLVQAGDRGLATEER